MAAHVESANVNAPCENEDPGAAHYGNFINYYTFNPPGNRLSLIPTTLLQEVGYGYDIKETVLLLDVGCNSGDLSVALYRHLLQEQLPAGDSSKRDVHLLGFDLDKDLILRAQRSNPLPQNLTFIPLDIMQENACHALEVYLEKFGCSRFHLCTCFAVTMWVHLNHGDAAFLEFLSRIARLSQYLLLEAQPWKCYRSAARRLRKLGRNDFDHFKTLKIRGDMAAHATDHLEKNCDMELVQSFGNTTWDRNLLLFKRR
ncbi:pre-miRNA 5'-monophosphate methyltransferase [Chanos chanos]|uniref:RNA methyltransferase n=1 Tax=Chanos chanos TaxID=29144 RepID=A0A6J2VQ47_CHACN|nr:RNA 5'-monophosphate methyltransferase [Chanos chanos]